MRHLRKRIFVDSEVQGALIRRVIVHWIAFAMTLAVILAAVQFFQDPIASFDEHVAAFPRRHGLTFVVLLVLLPAFLWDTAKLSHRFSGPVLRLRRMLKELAAGEDPGELRFRDQDFWSDLGDHFNGVRTRVLQAQDHPFASETTARELATTARDTN
jgi:hypothetical protein